MVAYTDDELMRAVAGGDDGAFDILVRRHRRWVLQLGYAITRDRELAEDLAQEVFARAARHAGSYAGDGRFVAWLKRIAVNQGRDHLRREQRIRCLPESVLAEEAATGPLADPEQAAFGRLAAAGLRAAIEELPDAQRRALVLRYFQDLSTAEIAAELDCPEGTVKSRIRLGLFAIRRRLGDYQERS